MDAKDLAAIRAENRAIRDRFLADVPTVPLSRDMETWVKAGAIFAVTGKEVKLVPAFQLDTEGKPRPIIRTLLQILPPNLSQWQRAFWFASSNSWLGGQAPYSMLDHPIQVTDAARMEVQGTIG